MKNDSSETHIIRFGGLIETFYISALQSTCNPQEATRFSEEHAKMLANKLQETSQRGVRAIHVGRYTK